MTTKQIAETFDGGPKEKQAPKSEDKRKRGGQVAFFGKRLNMVARDVEKHQDELPRHIDHERRGIDVVQRFLNRLRGDNRCKKICIEITKHHMKAERFRHMRRGKQMRFVNALYKLDLVDPLLHIVEADYGKDISPAVAPFREIAGYKTAELGLDPENFEGKSGEQIQDLILQRQLERLGN